MDLRLRLAVLAWAALSASGSRPEKVHLGASQLVLDSALSQVQAPGEVRDQLSAAASEGFDTLLETELAGESLVVLFNLILSLGCSVCILIGTWPFRGMMASWFWTKHRYTWPSHIMLTWFDVGCIGLFTTNLYCLLTYPSTSRAMAAAGMSGGLPFEIWKGNFIVNCVMQGLWGMHNFHQWIIIMRGADKGTDTEWRRPYPMFLWSILGACGTGFVRNLFSILNGSVNDTVTWVTGIYEVVCLLLIVADLLYFLLFEHSCGANMAEDYGEEK